MLEATVLSRRIPGALSNHECCVNLSATSRSYEEQLKYARLMNKELSFGLQGYQQTYLSLNSIRKTILMLLIIHFSLSPFHHNPSLIVVWVWKVSPSPVYPFKDIVGLCYYKLNTFLTAMSHSNRLLSWNICRNVLWGTHWLASFFIQVATWTVSSFILSVSSLLSIFLITLE